MATVTEFGKFLSVQRSPDTGEIIGYRVRSPKNKIEQYFGIKTHGTLAKALKAAQSFAETNLKNKVLTTNYENKKKYILEFGKEHNNEMLELWKNALNN